MAGLLDPEAIAAPDGVEADERLALLGDEAEWPLEADGAALPWLDTDAYDEEAVESEGLWEPGTAESAQEPAVEAHAHALAALTEDWRLPRLSMQAPPARTVAGLHWLADAMFQPVDLVARGVSAIRRGASELLVKTRRGGSSAGSKLITIEPPGSAPFPPRAPGGAPAGPRGEAAPPSAPREPRAGASSVEPRAAAQPLQVETPAQAASAGTGSETQGREAKATTNGGAAVIAVRPAEPHRSGLSTDPAARSTQLNAAAESHRFGSEPAALNGVASPGGAATTDQPDGATA
ncbi:MAG TPA: hypothetical protein VFS62_16715, partial [Chloroflexota bacterium]|nr:hypothetical protein [Chloroflexota bacterium]